MGSADRLRQAADALDKKNLVRWVTVTMEDGHPSVTTEAVPQVQAVLRAVADRMDEQYVVRGYDCVHCRNARDCKIGDYCAEHAAALALADAILEDSDG